MRDGDRGRSEGKTRAVCLGWCLTGLVLLSLVVGACGPVTPEVGEQPAAAVVRSPVPTTVVPATATDMATPVPTAVPTATPQPTATPLPAPVDLVILHTNDNWGETEPCG